MAIVKKCTWSIWAKHRINIVMLMKIAKIINKKKAKILTGTF